MIGKEIMKVYEKVGLSGGYEEGFGDFLDVCV